MANKTIPELDEIDIGDVTVDQLFVIDTGLLTLKLRMSTLLSFIFGSGSRHSIEVAYDGSEVGVKTVDVSSLVDDATIYIWMLKNPDGKQLPAMDITTPDADTVEIDSGEFALAVGTYTLIGV